MAAKKKTQTDEPINVEELDSDTMDPANAPAQDPPSGDTDTPATNTDSADTTDETPATTDDTDVEPDDTDDKPAEEQHEPAPAHEEMEIEEQPKETQAENPSDFFGAPPKSTGGGLPKTVLAALALLLVGGGVAGFMFLKSDGQFLGASSEATPEPAVEMMEATPEPEEDANLDLTEFSVQVLNGSGTPGEAGEVKALLEKAGFEGVETGNAKSQTAKVTTISAKAGVPKGAISAVEDALEGEFATEIGNELDEASDFDIVVSTGGATDSGAATGSAEDE